MKVNKAFMQEINTRQKNNTELQGKIQSRVTVKIKEYNLEYKIPKQYLICVIQNFTPGTNFFIRFILI